MTWLDRMKVALVNEDVASIDALSLSVPPFRTKEEMLEAKALIGEGLALLKREAGRLRSEMEKLKKSVRYHQEQQQGKRFAAYS